MGIVTIQNLTRDTPGSSLAANKLGHNTLIAIPNNKLQFFPTSLHFLDEVIFVTLYPDVPFQSLENFLTSFSPQSTSVGSADKKKTPFLLTPGTMISFYLLWNTTIQDAIIVNIYAKWELNAHIQRCKIQVEMKNNFRNTICGFLLKKERKWSSLSEIHKIPADKFWITLLMNAWGEHKGNNSTIVLH